MGKITTWDDHVGRRLKLRDLRLFFAVVESGSMAKVAAQLGVSQPAVSQVMADLEHALGVRLLDRSRKGVEPTIYGQALLKRGLVALDELKQSVRDIQFLADPATGELKIGCPESLAGAILPQFIERFSERYPRVLVHIANIPTPALTDPGLRERKYDLILARLAIPRRDQYLLEDLNVECLFDDPLILAAGAHNRWARRRKVDLAELVEEPWILAPPNTWNYSRVAEAFQMRGIDMPIAGMVTMSVPLIINFLAKGSFIAAFPRSATRLNSLRELPVEMPDRPFPVAIVTLKNRTSSPVVERFIECAREVAKSLGGWPVTQSASRRKRDVA
jgi:DNA-binding transcriptional LysR family regulator